MGKFGKKVTINKELNNYMIGVMAPSGWGKSTLMYNVCDKEFGDEGYLLFDMGSENGTKAIAGVVAETVPTWKKAKEIIDDIVKNKDEDYPNLKVVIWDTIDATFEIAEQYTVTAFNREHMSEQGFRPATSINSCEGGFGRGMDRVIETVKKEIKRLNDVGVGVWWTSHVKERDQTDLFSGSTYTQLTASMTMKYFNSIRDISHVIGFGYYNRNIEKHEVGEANPITKKKKTRESVVSEDRMIKFRDDSLVADAKSRFANIIDEIPLDANEFIKAIQDAIDAAAGTPTTKARTKKSVKVTLDDAGEMKKAVEDVAEEVDTDSDDDLFDEDDNTPPFDVDDEDDFDEDAVKAQIRKLNRTADDDTKKAVKEILNGKKLNDVHDQETLNEMLEALA